MRQSRLMLAALLCSCAYVNKSEYEAAWDGDGDGWPVGEDCDDAEALIYPYAPDREGDGCDADCGTQPDADGDDYPDDGDCGPDDPTAYPCSPDEVLGDGVDSDCDGEDGVRTVPCAEDPTPSPPACP